jgi:uncharacterized protein with beta-barrel porin domain
LLWWDRAEPALWYDSSEAADIADPIDPAEANEPTLANDAKDAALPIERTESWEQMERTEFSDQRDHTPSNVALVQPHVPLVNLARCSSGEQERVMRLQHDPARAGRVRTVPRAAAAYREPVTLTSNPPVTEAGADFARRVKAGSGLTTPGAVLVGGLLLAIGAMADLAFGDSLGIAFATMFVIASAAMAMTVRVRSLASAFIAPPLLFAGATMVFGKLSGEVHGSRALALDTATSLALSAPVLFGGTALAAAIAVVRLGVAVARRNADVRR